MSDPTPNGQAWVFDTEEVAGYIKIPAKTLEQWRYLGKGPAYIKVGKHVRYRASAVNAWLDSQSKTPAAPSSSPVGDRGLDVDELAQIIRTVDGDHTLGAGALAEAIVAALAAADRGEPTP